MASDAFLPRGRGADRRRPRRPGERCVRGRRSCERTPRAGRLDDSRAQHHPGAAGSIHSFASAGRKSTDADGPSTARWRESAAAHEACPSHREARKGALHLQGFLRQQKIGVIGPLAKNGHELIITCSRDQLVIAVINAVVMIDHIY